MLRDAETVTAQHVIPPGGLAQWVGRLPRDWRSRPEARLAVGFDVRARTPLDALPLFAEAAAGFRARGDDEGELAAILQDGAVRWAANDMAGMFGLYERVLELADQGSRGAFELAAIGSGAIAHIGADSTAVLAALDGVGPAVTREWLPTIHWFRSVAHRRNGDLQRAYDELTDADLLGGVDADMVQQLHLARLRTDWLAGHVDAVCAELPAIHEHFAATGNRFLATESAIELAVKAAILDELDTARKLLAEAEPLLPDMPGQLARILHGIAAAAVAVGVGAEDRAADLLRDLVLATLGQPDGWYWRDRGAIALTYVLVPESRERWADEPLGRVHVPGLRLGEALIAARAGDLHTVRRLEWPAAGIVRAHLPARWIVELAAAARAAGTPAPSDLIVALGSRLHRMLKALASDTDGATGASALAWLRQVPPVPEYRLRVEVLGPLRILRDEELDHHPDLQRQRVRQLLSYLIVLRRARRERVAEDLWPDAADAGQSLRVTLTHLQRALQPERSRGDLPYFVATDGPWLTLTGHDRLEVDAWQLDDVLDQANDAEAAGNPGAALAAYRRALPLWGGEPFADVPYDDWASPQRRRLQTRYCAGAIRAGELLLAAGAATDAIAAGEQAITADPTAEAAYALVTRSQLNVGDPDERGAHSTGAQPPSPPLAGNPPTQRPHSSASPVDTVRRAGRLDGPCGRHQSVPTRQWLTIARTPSNERPRTRALVAAGNIRVRTQNMCRSRRSPATDSASAIARRFGPHGCSTSALLRHS